ncbi:ferredoxin [Streptomyces tendae]
MRIDIDLDKCCGAGQCVLAAPETFDQREEDGLVVLLDADPPAARAAGVREAAALCPALAIEVSE